MWATDAARAGRRCGAQPLPWDEYGEGNAISAADRRDYSGGDAISAADCRDYSGGDAISAADRRDYSGGRP